MLPTGDSYSRPRSSSAPIDGQQDCCSLRCFEATEAEAPGRACIGKVLNMNAVS